MNESTKFSRVIDQKVWFCGCENLTSDSQGYIYWKGVCIEHYSFGPNRIADQVDAARILSAVCTKIEKDGGIVASSSVVNYFRKIDIASGFETPKYLVLWRARKSEFDIEVSTVNAFDMDSLKEEISVKKQLKMANQPEGMLALSYRNFLVVSKEDFVIALECIDRDLRWIEPQFPVYRAIDMKIESEKYLRKNISLDILPSRSYIENNLLPDLINITDKSSENLVSYKLTIGQNDEDRQLTRGIGETT